MTVAQLSEEKARLNTRVSCCKNAANGQSWGAVTGAAAMGGEGAGGWPARLMGCE
jgi:hypothetical protein